MTVRRARIVDVVRDVSGGNRKLPQSEFLRSGRLPVVDQGRNFVAGYTDDETYRFCRERLPVVVFGDHTKAVKFVDFPFAIGADGVKVLKPTDDCDTKYLYHFLRHAKFPDAGYSRHFKFLRELRISLPALTEQRRISAILDKVDALRTQRREAIAKLDQLLLAAFLDMFGDPVVNAFRWPMVPFTEVGEWKSGGTPAKSESSYWNGVVPWVSPKDMKVDLVYDAKEHITDLAISETGLKKLKPGHLLIVVRGMILAHSFPTAVNNVSITINQDMKAIEPRPDFHVMYLKAAVGAMTPRILKAVSSAGHGTKRLASVDASGIMVPKPPMELQVKFGEVVAAFGATRVKATKHLGVVQQLFGALQDRAFSGTL